MTDEREFNFRSPRLIRTEKLPYKCHYVHCTRHGLIQVDNRAEAVKLTQSHLIFFPNCSGNATYGNSLYNFEELKRNSSLVSREQFNAI